MRAALPASPALPRLPFARFAMSKNKARLTVQTAPRRRFPGHWPTPGAETLAVAEADVGSRGAKISLH